MKSCLSSITQCQFQSFGPIESHISVLCSVILIRMKSQYKEFFALSDDESCLNLPFENITESPLNIKHMRDKQYADNDLLRLKEKYPERYFTKEIGDVKDLICWVKEHDDPLRKWKKALPTSMIKPTIKWFHLVTGHPGQKRLYLTLQAKYYHPQLRSQCDKYKCADCQKHKLSGKGYGLLPERELRSEPFEEVAVDLIWSLENIH